MAEGWDKTPMRDRRKLDARRTSGSRKDTKKWCRGKVGRKHEPVCKDYAPYALSNGSRIFAGWRVLACANCGRHLDYYMPTRGSKRPQPEWVK